VNFRPVPARWFEVLAPRSDTARVLGTLARTGAVELEVRASEFGTLSIDELRTGVDDYRRLLGRYVRYWARGDLRRSSEVIAPAVVTQRSLQRIAQWRQRADPLIHRLQALEEEAGRLKFWLRVLGCSRHRHLDLSVLAGTGPVLGYVIAVLPDHLTPVERGDHVGEPVPVLIYDPDVPADEVTRFDEQSVLAGSLGAMTGAEFIETLLGRTTRR